MTAGDEAVGAIVGTDLTVPNAGEVRDFYAAVVGWTSTDFDLGDRTDYVMSAPGGGEVAGICHPLGDNADLPPQWLVYVRVADLDASMAKAARRGGRVVAGPKRLGGGRYCVVQDPAGAVLALVGPAADGP